MRRVFGALGVLFAACGGNGGGSEGVADTTTGPPAQCADRGDATGEFWIMPRVMGEVEPSTCIVDDLRLATDDLDVEIDIDCDPARTGDVTRSWTIKLGPVQERPTIAIGDEVRFEAAGEMMFCDEIRRFTLHRDDGELIAAGLTPAHPLPSIATGQAGPLTLRTIADDGCAALELELGETIVALRSGDATTIASGPTSMHVEVGAIRVPVGEGDDCGGSSAVLDMIVIGLP